MTQYENLSAVANNWTDVEIEPTISDMLEERVFSEFVEKGCGCKLLKGQQ